MPAQTEAVLGTTKLIRLLNTQYRLELFNGGGTDTFKLSVLGETTASMIESVGASGMTSALEALTAFSAGDISVVKTVNAFTIEFTGNYIGKVLSLTVGSETGTLESLLNEQLIKPAVIGSSALSSGLSCVIGSSGDYAYTISSLGEFAIFDVSTPSAPVKLAGSFVDLAAFGTAVEYLLINQAETLIYASASTLDGLTIVDVSTKTAPAVLDSLLGETNLDNGLRSAIGGSENYIYIASRNQARITLVDVSTPAAIALSGSVQIPSTLVSVEVKQDESYAFSAAQSDGDIFSIDVSTPATPVLSDTLAGLITKPTDMRLSNDDKTLFILDTTENKVVAIDVLDPTNMQHISTLEFPGVVLDEHIGITPDGTKLVVTDRGNNSIYFVDAMNPAQMAIVGVIQDATGLGSDQRQVGTTNGFVATLTRSLASITTVSITDIAGTETTIGSQVDSSETISNGKDEITNKQSPSTPGGGLAKEHILTDQEVTLDMNNIFTPSPGDAGQLAGKSAAQNLQIVQIVIYDSDAASREILRNAIIQNFSENAAHNSARRQSWAIMRSGSSEFVG